MWAQGNGGLSGSVTDPSDAVVPGASVTLTQLETGVERTFTTDQNGFYSFPELAPGDYMVTVVASGFQTAQSTVSIRVNQLARVDLGLQLGSTTETITVQAIASQVNFENAT